MQYNNTDRGVLFNDQDKKREENDRDYSGNINVGGVEYWLSGWINTSAKTGKKFLSLSVKPKTPNADRVRALRDETSDDIPF